MNKLFKHYIFNTFCEKYNIHKDKINQNNHWYFRYICFKYNYFMKHVHIPKIKKKTPYEAVMVEFREFPHIEFILRNAIIHLGSEWCHTIVCGLNNYEMITNMVNQISTNINIIKLEVTNKTQTEYSQMLTTKEFWDMLHGTKILIYQEDSFIFKNNIQDFLEFDYIGAPFPKNVNDTPNLVGNGGLSLRTRKKMLEVIETISIENTLFNSSTIHYMKKKNLIIPPEDVYFSKNMQEFGIGVVADWDSASAFSTESVNNINSFGGHKFWIGDKNWKERFKKMFFFSEYYFHNDIIEYLNYNNAPISFDKTKTIKNAFDVDLYFFSKVNNFPYSNHKEVLKYIKHVGLHGYLYHPKQLLNIFPQISFYHFLDNIYIFNKLNIFTIQDFTNRFLYNLSYDNLVDKLIKKKFCKLVEKIDLLLIVFIGNEERGLDLIERIIEYKKIQPSFNVSFCFNSEVVFSSEIIKKRIKENFKFYAIYVSNELGTDITPTLLMYNEICKEYNFNHIIKLHTKSISNQYYDLTDYLLNKPLNDLLYEKNNISNCIGHPSYYMNLTDDVFNNELKLKHTSDINISKLFVAGTIFYIPGKVLDKVIEFIKKNNFRSYFLNNLYENNTINKDFSPIHFLERLFGVIKH